MQKKSSPLDQVTIASLLPFLSFIIPLVSATAYGAIWVGRIDTKVNTHGTALEKYAGTLETVVEKLDENIGKLTIIQNDVSNQLAVHEVKIEYLEKKL